MPGKFIYRNERETRECGGTVGIIGGGAPAGASDNGKTQSAAVWREREAGEC